MDFSVITSKENKLVKSVKKLLTSSKERKQTGTFVLEGLRLSADAAINGYTVDTLIIAESVEESDRLNSLVEKSKTVVKVSDSLFSYMSDTVSPQGVMCIVKMPQMKSIEDIKSGRYIVLENTADPANLGAIARTAEAFGISGLIVLKSGCDPFSPKSQRAGMGALLRLPVIMCDDIADTVKLLKSKGFELFASVVSNADCNVTEVDFSRNCAVLIGNEANGLTDTAISFCDRKITIPMRGRAESLNAAAAASVIMWEMTRKEGL